jgi:hypothetical protein
MSLVGSLEDLGLGEILQIVSLSGKSGVLWIRSPQGEGRIVFDRGAIRGATLDGGARDLGEMLAASGALPAADVEALDRDARAEGVPLEDLIVARTALDAARLDELRERHVEALVLRMFSWRLGEFSFEIRDEPGATTASDLLLRAGMNAQFLALEGTRLRDEDQHAGGGGETPVADDPDTSFADLDGPAELEITVLEMVEDLGAEVAIDAEPVEAVAATHDEDPTLSGEAQRIVEAALQQAKIVEAAVPAAPALPAITAVVIVDRDLAVLEWAKSAIAPLGLRTHIFQRSELAIQRIRQYFARGEQPLLVMTSETPADPVSGARDWSELAARLRAQVALQPIVVLASAGSAIAPANERSIPDAVATRPPLSVLADDRAREKRGVFAAELRAAIERAQRRETPRAPATSPPAPPAAAAAPDPGESLRSLRDWSARFLDPAPPSEVLRRVVEFAARDFDRAVVFTVRDGEAQAVAQLRLDTTGGPGDDALRSLCVATETSPALHKAVESRAPVRASASEPGDRALAAQLGAAADVEFYVAPIESGEQVAALLYADNAASGRAFGDTSALEVIVHEASLALDRAVLEHALEKVEASQPQGPGSPGR